jgi:hypothetical protein
VALAAPDSHRLVDPTDERHCTRPGRQPRWGKGRYAAPTPLLRTLLVALALLLPACGGGGGGATDDGAGVGPAPPPSGPLVVMVRYGGIAGSNDRVAVDALGVATLISDRSPNQSTRTLPAGDLAALRTALQRADMATLKRDYLDHQARDAYQFDVTYQGVTVTADEAVIPPRLRPVVDILSRLIE